MVEEQSELVVVGLGAGAAIAYELAGRGFKVTVLDRDDGRASTLNNQCWKHSGLLQRSERSARELWAAFARMQPLERRSLRARGARFLVAEEARLAQLQSTWSGWGIPFARLGQEALDFGSPLGRSRSAGGFTVPDSIIDFPALLADLGASAERFGARIVWGATVKRLLREGDAIVGILYEHRGEEVVLRCRHGILAAGASAFELLAGIGIELPLARWKCHIVTFEGELVPQISAWLDPPGLTLVPFGGCTLVADTRRVPALAGDDLRPLPEGLAALQDDLAACFPRLRPSALRLCQARAAIKTELRTSGSRDQGLAVFGSQQHGLRGLTVAFPGKASLMFTLARAIVGAVGEELGRRDAEGEPARAAGSEA